MDSKINKSNNNSSSSNNRFLSHFSLVSEQIVQILNKFTIAQIIKKTIN